MFSKKNCQQGDRERFLTLRFFQKIMQGFQVISFSKFSVGSKTSHHRRWQIKTRLQMISKDLRFPARKYFFHFKAVGMS